MVHLTPGEKGNVKMAPEQYREQRIKEAEAAANILGAESIILDYKDGELPLTDSAKFTICDLTRRIKPDIVITHWKGSFHRDHRICHDLVMEGTFWAALPGIKRELPAHQIAALYYAENWEDPFDLGRSI
jgi:LmbE family N-acetylglucosaminyl deacetylase